MTVSRILLTTTTTWVVVWQCSGYYTPTTAFIPVTPSFKTISQQHHARIRLVPAHLSSRLTTPSSSHRIYNAAPPLSNVITEHEESTEAEEQEEESSPSTVLTSLEQEIVNDDAKLWELKKQLDAFNRVKNQGMLQIYEDITTTTTMKPYSSTFNIEEGNNKDFKLGTIRIQDDTTKTAVSTMTPTTTTTMSLESSEEKEAAAIWKARLLLVVAAALYGTNFSLVKVLGDTMPVGVSAALRFGLASFLTLPWLLQPPKKVNTQETDEDAAAAARGATLAGFEVGMWNSIGYIAQAVGLATTDASKSAFICSLAVVVVPLLDFLNGKNLLSREIMGIILAVVGVGILELGGSDGGAATAMALSHGDLLSLVQPLAFGMAFWRMEKAMKKYPQEANRSTAAQLLAVFTMSAMYGSFVGFPETSVILNWLQDPHIVMALIWTGCITTALTVYMETIALKTLSAAETTLIFSTEPIWGAACASVVVGEQLGIGSFVGGALILAGCIISNLGMDGMFGKQNFQSFQNSFQTTFLPSVLASLGFASQGTFEVGDIVETDAMEVVEEVIKSVEVVEEVIKSAVDNM